MYLQDPWGSIQKKSQHDSRETKKVCNKFKAEEIHVIGYQAMYCTC